MSSQRWDSVDVDVDADANTQNIDSSARLRVVNDAERIFDSEPYYAQLMPIVQSSGAGKSWLIDEYGKTAVRIVFTLRIGDQSGYPPGDSTEYATVIAFLTSAVKLVMNEFDKYRSKDTGFASYLRNIMAPPDQESQIAD
ncbi:hypothetical protein BDD12DRAFT_898077 [Trichophaea hybrida]|nr:hypothetical protein BDD12DRAFT_898077 [Trichophaea hybrida]